MTQENFNTLARTALGTAALRACESERENALFVDPLAALFAGEETIDWVKAQPHDLGFWPVLRTRFLDDFLNKQLRQTSIRQVVLLAAGLDARAYRLTWPEDTRLFELDQPVVLDWKESILAGLATIPKCQRFSVRVDLEQSWVDELGEAGFDAKQPSIWIIEGLLYYLEKAVAQRIIETVTQLTSEGSWIGFDIVNQAALHQSEHQSQGQQASITWHFGVDDPQLWLSQLGWQASVASLGEIALRYGRWPYTTPPPINPEPGKPRVMFVVGERHKPTAT